MQPRLATHALVLLGVSLLLGGCASAAAPPTEGASAAVVTMHFHSFEPKTVTIPVGGTVRWENRSLIWHTVTADPALAKKPEDVSLPQGAAGFDSGKVEAGAVYQRKFTVPGTYRYFCQPHEVMGMVGEIRVMPPASSEERAKPE